MGTKEQSDGWTRGQLTAQSVKSVNLEPSIRELEMEMQLLPWHSRTVLSQSGLFFIALGPLEGLSKVM